MSSSVMLRRVALERTDDSEENIVSIIRVTRCKIGGFHGGDYEEWRLLGCYNSHTT
jgi:hypothetical protein